MSGGHSTYTPTSGLGRWIDARMPLPRLVYDSFVAYPVPRNLNYAYTFGAMLAVMLIVQILTGVVLVAWPRPASVTAPTTENPGAVQAPGAEA